MQDRRNELEKYKINTEKANEKKKENEIHANLTLSSL